MAPAPPAYAHAVPGRSADATVLTKRYTDAVEYARKVHDGDTRKGTAIPYLAHVLAVSALVLEAGGTEDQAIAALLHDTAEDHGGQTVLDEIGTQFGQHVADLVEACSDSLTADPNAKEDWWTRKVRYLQRLSDESPEVALVSCADKVHNARAILSDYHRLGEELWSRFNPAAGREGTLWYYERLAAVLTERLAEGNPGAAALSAELRRTVESLSSELATRRLKEPVEEGSRSRSGQPPS
jgi:(p)ppGpp synthase/HD superfamily hydrolase